MPQNKYITIVLVVFLLFIISKCFLSKKEFAGPGAWTSAEPGTSGSYCHKQSDCNSGLLCLKSDKNSTKGECFKSRYACRITSRQNPRTIGACYPACDSTSDCDSRPGTVCLRTDKNSTRRGRCMTKRECGSVADLDRTTPEPACLA